MKKRLDTFLLAMLLFLHLHPPALSATICDDIEVKLSGALQQYKLSRRSFTGKEALARVASSLKRLGYDKLKIEAEAGQAVLVSADKGGKRVMLKIPKSNEFKVEQRLIAEAKIMNELSAAEAREKQKYFLSGEVIDCSTVLFEYVPVLQMEFISESPGRSKIKASTLKDLPSSYLASETAVRDKINNQIAAALIRAEQLGIIHLDIKPSNILVVFESGEPRIKIIDWGIAAYTEEVGGTGYPVLSQGGGILGSAGFMGPDQLSRRSASGRMNVENLIRLDFRTRRGLPYTDSTGMAGMFIYPEGSSNPTAQEPFKDPAVALDQINFRGTKLSERERLVAAMEFSRWPENVTRRQELLTEARDLKKPISQTLAGHAKRLLSMDPVIEKAGYLTVRYNGTLDILRSSFMIDKLGAPDGLPFEKKDLEAFIRTAYIQKLTAPSRPELVQPGMSYKELNFGQFEKRVKVLFELKLIDDPSIYLREAEDLREGRRR